MKILHNNNPLDPARGIKVYDLPDGVSGNQAFKAIGLSKSQPVVLIVDGSAWGRTDWDKPLPTAGVVIFQEIQQGLGFIVCAIIAIAAAAYAYYMASKIGSVADTGTPDSIYSFSTGANKLRIGEPFAEPMGRLRIYPDLAQQSYVQNIGNDQYLYFLGIIGVGEYAIEDVYIEKTQLTDYEDSSYNIIAPGGSFSLIPNIVWTCNEVSSQELDTDWVTYVVSSPGTEAYFIEYDITFSSGLVGYNDEGNPYTLNVTIQTQARRVNATGEGITDWTHLETKTFSAADKDPLRYSRKLSAPHGPGRYQFRACRTTEASESSRQMDKATLSGLRAYGGTHPDYSDVAGLDLTMIECKIKASDQLNGDCGSQINVVGTRKLYPVTATGFAATLAATRNISDICAYIVTSDNGGRQDDDIIDFESLYDLRSTWESDEHYFDYRFDSRTSVMDACATVATCGRAVPYMPGGLFSLVRNEEQSLPACVFTRDNISDLTITVNPRTEDSTTCVNVTYINSDSWEEESVTCVDITGSEDNPKEITLDGCTDRQHAYEMGMFFYYQDILERSSVEFVTSLMGHIPSLLSKIIVPNTMICWGQDGIILDYDESAGVFWLSEPVDFVGADEGAIYICKADGSSAGPFTVYETAEYSHAVQGAITGALQLSSHDLKATRYLFGPAPLTPMFVRVNQIQPQGKDKIKITGTLINDDVYDDPGTAPELGSVVGSIALLAAISVYYTGMDDDDYAYSISWSGSADTVLVELSEDGGSYGTLEDGYEDHALSFTSSYNVVSIRVTPYDDNGDLDTEYTLTSEAVVLLAPTGLTISYYNTLGIAAVWNAYPDATGYIIEVYAEGALMFTGNSTETYHSVKADAVSLRGGPWDEITVSLQAVTDDGTSPVLSVDAEYDDSYVEEVLFDNTGSMIIDNDSNVLYTGGIYVVS